MRNADLYEEKSRIVSALAHPVRLAILDCLATGPSSAGGLVSALDLPQPLVSQHLAVLRKAGVVTLARRGSRHIYALADPQVSTACALMGEIVARLIQAERTRLAPLARAVVAR